MGRFAVCSLSSAGKREQAMFDHKHYVPILRWKRAEWVALRDLAGDVRSHITPLVELTPRSFEARNNRPAPDPADVLARDAIGLQQHWATNISLGWLHRHYVLGTLKRGFVRVSIITLR